MVGWAVDGSAKTMSLLRRKFKAAQLKAILAKPGAPAKDSEEWKMLHLWWAVLTALVCTKS